MPAAQATWALAPSQLMSPGQLGVRYWQVGQRRAQVEAFNQAPANRWRKRGLSMLPVKYNIDTTYYHMSSSVRIFGADGTVHVVHGGCELGQGINTKVAQAVAYALQCPLDQVTIGDTSTLADPSVVDQLIAGFGAD